MNKIYKIIFAIIINLSSLNIDCAARISSVENAELSDKEKKLLDASQGGNFDEVKKLIEEGVNINVKSIEHGATPLMLAAYNGHKNIVEFLLENNADVNLFNNDGNTALIGAIAAPVQGVNYQDIIELLLQAGADVNFANIFGNTPIIQAAIDSDQKILKRLIEENADINKESKENFDAMKFAVQYNKPEIIKLLKGAGYDINKRNKLGITALYLALSQKKDKDLIKLLIDLGADVNITDNRYYASPLIIAVMFDDIESARFLINAGANVNYFQYPPNIPGTNLQFVTVLSQAIKNGNVEMVDLLLRNGADVNVDFGKRRETHLIYALYYQFDELKKFKKELKELQAQINKAKSENRLKLLSDLEQRHKDVNQFISNIQKRSIQMAHLLLSAGADINVSGTIKNRTPLMLSILDDRLDLAKLLIDFYADINLKDDDGNRAIDIARNMLKEDPENKGLIHIIKVLEDEPRRRIKAEKRTKEISQQLSKELRAPREIIDIIEAYRGSLGEYSEAEELEQKENK